MANEDSGNGNIRDRVISAARDLFLKKGFHGTATREIARNAGTSESGMYRYFESKLAILQAVYDLSWGTLNRKVDAMLPHSKEQTGDVIKAIISIVKAVCELYNEDRDSVFFMFVQAGLSAEMYTGADTRKAILSTETMRFINRVGQLFERGCREGRFAHISPVAAREALLGIIEGTVFGWVLANSPDGDYDAGSPEDLLIIVRRFLHGLQLSGNRAR